MPRFRRAARATSSNFGMPDRSSDSESIARRLAELERDLEAERDARARAEDANRRKDEFLAILSHDLRSPLNAVVTWLQVLRSPQLDASAREQALASLERITKLQARMIEDLLDISRIISGKLSLEPQDVDLVVIVRAAVETTISAALEKGIDLDVAVDPKCVPMRGDSERLQQVVANLLSNAIKFTPSGGKVSLTLRCEENTAEISITDTGEGIPADVLPFVFERFRQGNTSTTRRHGGLGLGLAIARHLVELHGGNISAASEGEGQGATFRLRIPLVRAKALAALPVTGAASELPALTGVNVLIVDDDTDTCSALEIVLQLAGCDARSAESVPAALRAFNRAHADVVVTDIAMPGEDGYVLLSELRGAGHAVPVIALTASATPEDRRRVMDAGFVLHITKPVDPSELLLAVGMTIAGRAAQFAAERAVIAARRPPATPRSRRDPVAG
jgi:signal transduction histidine kinase/CheY-like chemotaxis protein